MGFTAENELDCLGLMRAQAKVGQVFLDSAFTRHPAHVEYLLVQALLPLLRAAVCAVVLLAILNIPTLTQKTFLLLELESAS